jgi:AcrR family transcriptional regulator
MVKRTKKDAAETRLLIIDQASVLFEQNGYKATTLDDIARAAGVTKGAIFHHFESKKSLFTHIWVALQQEMDTDIRRTAAKVAAESADPFAGMMAGARTQVGYLKQPRFSKIVMLEGPGVLGMDEWMERDVALSKNRINKAIDYLIGRGQLATGHKESLNLLFLGMLSYAVIASRNVDDPQPIIDSFEIILRGLPNSVAR